MGQGRIVVIDVVGLSPAHFQHREKIPHLRSLLDRGKTARMKPVFPAVTLPVQASLTTGESPATHGVVANGFFFRDDYQVSFREQSARLVQSERIWDRLKRLNPDLKTAVLFFQNTLYAACEAIITPNPLHTDAGLIQWCYSKPAGLYEEICEKIGEFNLFHYQGPKASIKGSRWIADSAVEVMDRIRPDLMYVSLPHLDYPSRKLGPGHPAIPDELEKVDREIGRIIQGIGRLDLGGEPTYMVLSEYAFSSVDKDIPINRILRRHDLLRIRTIKGREYLDMELSPAFAMVDHQVAHLYVKPGLERAVRNALDGEDDIAHLFNPSERREMNIHHVRAGELVAVSARDCWFSYPWWEDRSKEPDFATHLDNHRKPGYDPLELFLEPGTRAISQDTSLIRGSHGYPPVSGADDVPFLISGPLADQVDLPESISVLDVPGMIESILTEQEDVGILFEETLV